MFRNISVSLEMRIKDNIVSMSIQNASKKKEELRHSLKRSNMLFAFRLQINKDNTTLSVIRKRTFSEHKAFKNTPLVGITTGKLLI